MLKSLQGKPQEKKADCQGANHFIHCRVGIFSPPTNYTPNLLRRKVGPRFNQSRLCNEASIKTQKGGALMSFHVDEHKEL